MTSERSALRTVANVLGVLLLVGLVAPFVVYGVPQVAGADYSFVVLSGSMEPAMSPGDAIVVREAAPGEITERDVITFRTDSETPTTHRVIDVIERDGTVAYVTKGDANEDPDSGTVSHEQVLGEVLVTLPLLGYVVRFVNTPVGFAVVVVGPLVAFVLSEVWTLVRSVDGELVESESIDSGSADSESADSGSADSETGAATSGGTSSRGAAAEARDDAPAPIEAASKEPTPAESGSTSATASFTLTRSSLQLLGLVFAFYLPYSAYVAYTTIAAWTIAVAIATAIGLLFTVGLYVGTRGDENANGDADSDADGSAESSTEGADSDLPSEVPMPPVDGDDADAVYPDRSTAADGGSELRGRDDDA
ncbi:signal peptidase I [Halobellus sp. Atlit-38R]|uniref:signal peptidase I n=1 Tax=Halobellus sp. Atlit-38R TaxID=2282131 RepID=UPI000EF1C5D9|nr:signal peptidase I [Halobellus sp. Atlit-38R]RLM88324.1 signal peptidase I [Halobellus sp. Atlit-38R]